MGQLIDVLKRIWAIEIVRMLFIAAGIITCFVYYGIMQEKIMRGCFGGELVEGKCVKGEKYEYEFTLNLICAIVYAIVGRIILQMKSSGNPDKTHQGWYVAAAFTYASSLLCANMALRWINYPTQVISKSSKPIPVMFIGVLLAKKRYRIQKYFFVLMIVVGAIMFLYNDNKAKVGDVNNHIGLIFVGISLLSDGVLGAIEDLMRAATKPSAFNFMFSINMYSAFIFAIGTLATGEIFRFFEFAAKYPDVNAKIGSAAAVGAFGQVFIFAMVSEFGPLACSIVTTCRKFFTLLISVIFMGNPLIPRQKVATFIIFAVLFADAIWGKKQLCGKTPVEAVEKENLDLEKNEKQTSPIKDVVELQEKIAINEKHHL